LLLLLLLSLLWLVVGRWSLALVGLLVVCNWWFVIGGLWLVVWLFGDWLLFVVGRWWVVDACGCCCCCWLLVAGSLLIVSLTEYSCP
jgi:hypothetical protein